MRAVLLAFLLAFLLAACAAPEQTMFDQLVTASKPYQRGEPCKPVLHIIQSDKVSATSVNCTVTITDGLVALLNGAPDELAHTEAHELAHIVLKHDEASRAVEREADVIGVCIAAAAGYDLGAALKAFERVRFQTEEFEARMRFLMNNNILGYC